MTRLPVADLPHFLAKLDRYTEENPRRSVITRNALRNALLTWVRTKELQLAARSEFEGLGTPNAIWRIPAERMKMKREHIVPLSRQAEVIIAEMLAAMKEPCVFFQVTNPESPLSENTMISAIYRMGYISRQTVHGFRSIASTWANEQLVEYGDPPIWMRRYHADWVENEGSPPGGKTKFAGPTTRRNTHAAPQDAAGLGGLFRRPDCRRDCHAETARGTSHPTAALSGCDKRRD